MYNWAVILGHKLWNLNTVKAEWEMKQKQADIGTSAKLHNLLKCQQTNPSKKDAVTPDPFTSWSLLHTASLHKA